MLAPSFFPEGMTEAFQFKVYIGYKPELGKGKEQGKKIGWFNKEIGDKVHGQKRDEWRLGKWIAQVDDNGKLRKEI